MSDFQTSGVAAALGPYTTTPRPASDVVPFELPDWANNGHPAEVFAALDPADSLAAGLEPDIEELRSAVDAIPPHAIANEEDWMKFARGFAYEAAIFKKLEEPLWEILDAASRRAPGYDREDNRRRYERYISEALNRKNPITIASIYHLASRHGWQGTPLKASNNACAPCSATDPTGCPPGPTGATASASGAAAGSTTRTGPNGATFASRAVPVSSLPLIPPKRQWLHGTDLIRGAVTVLYAPGGRAKSTWLLICALACASGRECLGSHVFGGPLRVLCLSTEDGRHELALRLRAAMEHYGLTDADVAGLYVIGADGWGLPLLRAEANRAVLDTGGMCALTAELDHIKPDVLIIDPLINVMGGVNANDNAAAALLMGQLAVLASTRRISIALAHHVAKGRDVTSAESAMGAASFINLARIALAIEPLGEKDAGKIGLPPWEAWSVFRVLGTKQNFSPPNLKDRWFRLVSVEMANAEPPIYTTGDRVAVVVPFEPSSSGPAYAPALIRDALAAVDDADPPLSPSKQAKDRYAVPVIAKALAAHRGGHASDTEGESVLRHLLASNLVRVDDIKLNRPGNRGDIRKCLVLTPAGKAALNQPDTPGEKTSPRSPQSPAMSLHENAGGDPLGPPQPQGGCGGNAGSKDNGAESDLTSDSTDESRVPNLPAAIHS